MRRQLPLLLSLLLVPGGLTLAGCTQEFEPEPTASNENESTETAGEDDAPRPASGLGDDRGRGALSGAKRAANRTVGDLQNRDKDIQRELEDDE